MFRQKMTVLALASLLPLSLPVIAEEANGDQATGSDTVKAAEASSDDATPTTAAPVDAHMAAMQEHWREREARYEDLKRRAKEVGVMLPEDPPWKSSGMGMTPDMSERMQRHQAMMAMTPEERMAAHQEQYQQMQARQAARDESWEKYQAAIDGMTDEERAACHAMHRRHMGMMDDYPERPMMYNPGMGRGTMGPGTMGPGMMGPGMMGPGYGYGPNPYAEQNFWDPNQ